jgi:hypothetical protein
LLGGSIQPEFVAVVWHVRRRRLLVGVNGTLGVSETPDDAPMTGAGSRHDHIGFMPASTSMTVTTETGAVPFRADRNWPIKSILAIFTSGFFSLSLSKGVEVESVIAEFAQRYDRA